MAKKPSSKCEHCKLGRRVHIDKSCGGMRWHVLKESNGMDYDTHAVPCAEQTGKAMSVYRHRALTIIHGKTHALRERLNALEMENRRVKAATSPYEVQSAIEQAQSL